MAWRNYDRLLTPDGTAAPLRYRSMVSIIPMLTAAVVDEGMLDQAAMAGKQFAGFPGQQGPEEPPAPGSRSRGPVTDTAGPTGVIVTVSQLALVVQIWLICTRR